MASDGTDVHLGDCPLCGGVVEIVTQGVGTVSKFRSCSECQWDVAISSRRAKSDTERLLERIETLERRVAELEEEGDDGE